MTLNCSSEINGVKVQIECVVEIQFKIAWVVTNIISDTTCHA